MKDSSIITADLPLCLKCGYVLLGLTELRCPECGEPFDKEYVETAAIRARLLPWERREMGGRVRRLWKTIVLVSFHPHRYFACLRQRNDQRIANAGSLIVGCVLAATGLHVVSFLLRNLIIFVQFLVRSGQPGLALRTLARTVSITSSTTWFMPTLQLVLMLLPVAVFAVLIRRVFQARLGAFQSVDIMAAHSPALVLGAFFWVVGDVTAAISQQLIAVGVGIAVESQVGVLLLLYWICGRRLISLGRWQTVAFLVVLAGLEWGLSIAIGYVLSSITLLIM